MPERGAKELQALMGGDWLLTVDEAAEALGVSKNVLNLGRHRRSLAIDYVKLGNRVFYQEKALRQYLGLSA